MADRGFAGDLGYHQFKRGFAYADTDLQPLTFELQVRAPTVIDGVSHQVKPPVLVP